MEHKLKILIVTHFFPPQNAIAAQRPLSWAKYWGQAGHDVDVLTTPKGFYGTSSKTGPYNVHEVEISPLYRKARDWYHRSFKKQSSTSSDGPPKTSDKSLKKWLLSRGLSTSTRMPDPTDLWIPNAKKWIKDQGKVWDIVISTFGPYSTHVVAHYARTNYYAKTWCADFRDFWTDNDIYPGFPILKNIEKLMEKYLMKDADFISLDGQTKVDFFRVKYQRPTILVPNGYDEEEFNSLPNEPYFDKDKKIISYTGSIYPGLRDPTPFLNEIRELKEQGNRVDFEVHFYGQNVDILSDKLDGLEDIVKLEGMVTREDSLRIQRDSDLLLYLEHEKNNLDGVIPGKLYEYLNSKTPILAVGITESGDAGHLIKESGGYFSFKNFSFQEEENLETLKIDLKRFSRKSIALSLLNNLTNGVKE